MCDSNRLCPTPLPGKSGDITYFDLNFGDIPRGGAQLMSDIPRGGAQFMSDIPILTREGGGARPIWIAHYWNDNFFWLRTHQFAKLNDKKIFSDFYPKAYR